MIYEISDKKPKQKRREAKEKNILDMSLKLIMENGLDGFSINRLAAELDYTPGALYRYYSSRDAIIAELEAKVIADFHRYLQLAFSQVSVICQKDDQPLVNLLLLSVLYRKVARLEPGKYFLITAILADSRILVKDPETSKVVAVLLPLLKEISDQFLAAEKSGLLDSGKSISRTVIYLSTIQGILQLNKIKRLTNSLLDLEEIYHDSVETLFGGWGLKKELFERFFNLSEQIDLTEIIQRGEE